MAMPPLSEMDQAQRRELADALAEANTVDDLPGKWQAAILHAEQGTPGRGGRSPAPNSTTTTRGA